MAIVYSYPTTPESDLSGSDLLILSKMDENGRPTKSVTLSSLATYIANNSSGGGGGPFLPLSAGPTEALTGDLYMAPNGAGPSAGSNAILFEGIDDTGAKLRGASIFTLDSSVNPSGQDLYFQTADDAGTLNTNLYINAFGLVGIGTTNPNRTLDVSGSGNFEYTLTVGTDVQFGGTTGFRYFSTANSIGLGTSSPNFKMDIAGGDLRFEGNNGIRFGGTGSNNTNWRIWTSGDPGGGNYPGSLLLGRNGNIPFLEMTTGPFAPNNPGQIIFNRYGSGGFTGTATFNLSVDANGNIIETATSNVLPWVYEYDATDKNFVQGEGPNVSGTGNTGYGVGSLPILDTGNNNTAFGADAGLRLEASSNNTLIGFEAGKNIDPSGTTCDRNTLIGSSITYANNPQGDDNTCIGYRAGTSIFTGFKNVFIGVDSGRVNSLGADNVAIGYKSLELQGGSSRNIAIGSLALTAAQSGSARNTAIGYAAGTALTTGDYNVLLGYQAGNAITQASFNTLIGYEVAQSFVLGESNVYIGRQAGSNANGGSFNIAIGSNAQLSSSGISNEVNINNNSITARFQGGAAAWSFVSDARDKKDIEDLELGVEFINKLKPRKFKWDLRNSDVDKNKEASGFIAQEIQEILDETGVNYTGIVDTNDPDQYMVAQANIIPMLVKAVQELSAEVKMLKNK